MIIFRVTKEPDGWAVRMGTGASTPFLSRELAVREAKCLARELRAHGELTAIEIDEESASVSLAREE